MIVVDQEGNMLAVKERGVGEECGIIEILFGVIIIAIVIGVCIVTVQIALVHFFC
jgi:hypothetical protein